MRTFRIMQSLIDNKLLIFGGKGGVGKTSCAAATGIYSASNGKKTLVLSTDPAHSLSDSFDKKIGYEITKIQQNLDGLEIDAAGLLREYKKKYGHLLKQIADEGTFFSKEEISKFFDLSLPGMDELMAMVEVIDLLEDNKYDLIILDTAPTGHTIRLLELPELMTSYVKVLIEMRQKHKTIISMISKKYVKDKADEYIEKTNRDILRIKNTLKDGSKTKFIPITIPEAMSLYETKKLISTLEHHQIPIQEIIINNIINENCNFCRAQASQQEKYIKQIKNDFSNYRIKEVPLLPNEIRGENLKLLSRILYEKSYTLPKPKIIETKKEFKFDKLQVRSGIEFLLLGGKGGVGKTSMASAIALNESKNKKVLVFSTDPAHSLSDSFDIKIGNKTTNINKNLDALEIDSYSLLNEFKMQYKKEIQGFFKSIFKTTAKGARIDAPYDRKVMEDLFDLAPPGIDEIMGLKTMMDLIEEKKYDLFILDTAPSGHTIRLLEMPEVAESWLSTLLEIQESYPISEEIGNVLVEMLNTIKKVRKKLSDNKKTEFISVAIPEAMSVLETQDLLMGLKKLKVPVEYLIINKIFPDNNCNFCSIKRMNQSDSMGKLQKLSLKTVGVELFDEEIRGSNKLEKLNDRLYGSKRRNTKEKSQN